MALEKITQLKKMASFIADSRQYQRLEARRQALPPAYRQAYDGLWRYLIVGCLRPAADEAVLEPMTLDLLDLVEQWAADGLEIGETVGADPVGFVDDFFRHYTGEGVTEALQSRLRASIDEAAAAQAR